MLSGDRAYSTPECHDPVRYPNYGVRAAIHLPITFSVA